MRWRHCVFRLLNILLTLGAAVILVSGERTTGWTMDLDWGMNAGALVSDNIFRRSPGFEISGQIYRYRLNLELVERSEQSTYLLSGFGGWERTISDADDTRDLIYGLGVDLNQDLKRDYYIRLNAAGSRLTETLDPLNLNRTRALTDRVDAEFALGRESASQVSWEASVSANRVKRELEDSRIARLNALIRIPLNVRTNIHSEASGFMGDEVISGDEWTGANVNIGITSRSSPKTTRGANTFWAASSTDFAQTTATSDWQNIGLSGNQEGQFTGRTSYRAELGLESLNPWDSSRDYEPLVDLSLSTLLNEDVTFGLFAANRNAVSLNNRRQPVWSRRASAGVDLNWRTGGKVDLSAEVIRSRDDFPPGQATASRIEDGTLGRLGLLWHISNHVDSEIAYVSDQVNSTIPARDLQENRLELTVTGRF